MFELILSVIFGLQCGWAVSLHQRQRSIEKAEENLAGMVVAYLTDEGEDE